MVADPVGLLGRVPELEPLLSDAALRKAVESGNPHAVYRRLWWMRRKAGSKEHDALIDALLAQRRLFLVPIKSAPTLATVNGVGGSVYGGSEHDSDGTYIKSHFFVFLFVPLYPVAQYLVRDGEAARSWSFIGKVPLSTPVYIWQRLIALGALCGVLFGAGSAVHAAMYQELHIANAFDKPLVATIGAKSVELAPRSTRSVDVGTGQTEITIRDAGGTVVEQGPLDVRSDVDVLIWNVLGVAPVYQETVWYAAEGQPPRDIEGKLFCGQSAVAFDDVDYALEDPPPSLNMKSKEKYASRSHVGVHESGAETCFAWMFQEGMIDKAAEVAGRVAAAFPRDPQLVMSAANVHVAAGQLDKAITLARSATAIPGADLNVHRSYQEQMVRAGKRAELVEEYRKRATADAGADAAYLLARILPRSEALPLIEKVLAADPKHAMSVRYHGSALLELGRWAEADAAYERLRGLDEALWHESFKSAAVARLASERGQDALELLESHFAPDAPDAMDTAVMFARVAQASRLSDPAALISKLVDQHQGGAGFQTWCRARAGLPVTEEQLAAASSDLRVLAEATIAAAKSPADGLALVAEVPAQELRRLDPEVWALLFAEAMRTQPDHPGAKALASACPLGEREASLIASYVREGSSEGLHAIEWLPLDAQASLHFVRSRAAGLPDEERQALLEQARREDMAYGVASRAMTAWQAP